MVTFRPAATLILCRPAAGPSGFEVLLLHRSPGLRFLGDFWVFPGGASDPTDGSSALAAVRETFEETGLLLLEGAERVDAAAVAAQRVAVLDDPAAFPAALAALGLEPRPASLIPCGRWRTPPFGPLRFDTDFFLAAAPPGAEPHVIPGELDRAEWLDPLEAVARWRRDEALLAPPTRVSLEALATLSGAVADGAWLERAARAVASSHPEGGEWPGPIDFRPGIRLLLVRTPTLPPATHTNCYLVGDGPELVVIDPASPYPEEQARLDAVIDRLQDEGRRVREVLLTHHHPDHVGGAAHLAARLGVPIAAHARTREILEGKLHVHRTVEDGERIDLPLVSSWAGPTGGAGGARAWPGARPRRLRAILCEGHADGHLAFFEETSRGLITGDMVAGVGTILVEPPEGDMARYLASLERLRALGADVLYPAHGPPIGDPDAFLAHYVSHRLERERKIVDALAAVGPAEVEALLPRAYDDKPPAIYPLAARAALAHLVKLEAEGRARRDGPRWVAVP